MQRFALCYTVIVSGPVQETVGGAGFELGTAEFLKTSGLIM
jgi:hypothetical protein